MKLQIHCVIIIIIRLKVKHAYEAITYVEFKNLNVIIMHNEFYSSLLYIRMKSSSVMTNKHDILLQKY